ncbi:MAG: hypothetical protein H6575_12505 [Lewinellaceae bacterium]|nr:hypothetical protein [Lewinellaceae bacterium]
MLFQPAISIVGKQNKQIFNGFNRFQLPGQGNKTVKTVQFSSFSQAPRLKSRVEKSGITHVLSQGAAEPTFPENQTLTCPVFA